MSKFVRILMKNGQTRCADCGEFCQGFKDPFGKILCSDCYFKKFGERPKGQMKKTGLTGIKTQELFEKYKVFEYLDKFYDVLHTTGHRYIINNIDSYIEARINA